MGRKVRTKKKTGSSGRPVKMMPKEAKKEDPAHVKTEIVHVEDTVVCTHGPTVLFKSKDRCFYACSAFRNTKECGFFMRLDRPLSEDKLAQWRQRARKFAQSKGPSLDSLTNRTYCHSCEQLLLESEMSGHQGHDLSGALNEKQLRNPTKLLKASDKAQREAQFHFSQSSLDMLIRLVKQSGCIRLLCIGTPSIHEVAAHFGLTSLLLDLDPRLAQFFPSDAFCHYNLFNHHFFHNQEVYTKFLLDSPSGSLAVVLDPPFGGRCELIGSSLKSIRRQWSSLHRNEASPPDVFWIFPYYMQKQMHKVFEGLNMSDYQVTYRSDSSYKDGRESGGRKLGSPVRLFTSVPLTRLDLSGDGDKYKFCDQCRIWVAKVSQHCAECRKCCANNGGQFKHCSQCGRCVKASWAHCRSCGRCALPNHPCSAFTKANPQK